MNLTLLRYEGPQVTTHFCPELNVLDHDEKMVIRRCIRMAASGSDNLLWPISARVGCAIYDGKWSTAESIGGHNFQRVKASKPWWTWDGSELEAKS